MVSSSSWRLHDLKRLAGIALFQLFADAVHQDQPAGIDRVGLFGRPAPRFPEHMPAFAVAGEDEFHAQVLEHLDGNFAGERAVLLEIDILRAQQHGSIPPWPVPTASR